MSMLDSFEYVTKKIRSKRNIERNITSFSLFEFQYKAHRQVNLIRIAMKQMD